MIRRIASVGSNGHTRKPYTIVTQRKSRWYGIVSSPGEVAMASSMAAQNAKTATSIAALRDSPRLDDLELVAHIAHRADHVGVHLVPQAPHVDVDDVGGRVEAVAPHLREQLRAGAHLAGVAHQVQQEQELALGQGHPAAVDREG